MFAGRFRQTGDENNGEEFLFLQSSKLFFKAVSETEKKTKLKTSWYKDPVAVHKLFE